MPRVLRLASLEGERARSARESAVQNSDAVRHPKMTDRFKSTKNMNERPKRVEHSVEEPTRRRQRPPFTSSLRQTTDTHRNSNESAAVRNQRHSDKSKTDNGTGTKQRTRKPNIRAASYRPTTSPAMPSRDRSLAALAALHSSYKSASSIAMDSNDSSTSKGARVLADDMAINSLQDKLMALAGREKSTNNITEKRRIRSNSLDSGRDESLKGVSARKPRAMDQAGIASNRRELQRRILEDMRAKHQSARMRKMEAIGSRRANVQPGSTRGIRYKASSSSSSNDSPKPNRVRAYSPRPRETNKITDVKKEKKPVPRKSGESRVYFAPNDIDGAYERLGWDAGTTFQPRNENRRYPTVTNSALKRPARSSSVSDSLASGDTQSLTLADSSVENSSVVALDAGIACQRRTAPQLQGSLLVSFPSSRSNDDSKSPTSSLFESSEPAKLPARSSIRAKMAAERANIPERISEENSDDCQEESMKSSPTATSLGSSSRQYASDRTLPCSNLDKNATNALETDDSLICSIPSKSSSEFGYLPSSKYLSTPSQEDLDEGSSEDDEEDDMLAGESNDIFAISLSLADVASDSFRCNTRNLQKSTSTNSDKSKTSSLSTKSSDVHLRRQANRHPPSFTRSPNNSMSSKDESRSFIVQGRGIEPGAAPTQDSSDAVFIIEDPQALLPSETQGDANISDRAIFNRYWEKASPKHHASGSGKDLLQVSRRHSLGEDTESSESAAPPPVWAKMEARHGRESENPPSVHIGIIEHDGKPLPDVPRQNIQRASMA